MKKYLKDSEEQLRFRPLKDMPAACMDEIPMLSFQRELLENITSIDYLKEIGRTEGFEQVQVPAFELTGWNDFLRDETIYNYVQFKKRGGNERVRKGGRLIVGPWQHGDVLSDSLLGQYFGEEAGGDAIDISGKIADWYDFWIKGKIVSLCQEIRCICLLWESTNGGQKKIGRFRIPAIRKCICTVRDIPIP